MPLSPPKEIKNNSIPFSSRRSQILKKPLSITYLFHLTSTQPTILLNPKFLVTRYSIPIIIMNSFLPAMNQSARMIDRERRLREDWMGYQKHMATIKPSAAMMYISVGSFQISYPWSDGLRIDWGFVVAFEAVLLADMLFEKTSIHEAKCVSMTSLEVWSEAG